MREREKMPKVAQRRKTGGRVAGTPNKRTLDIQQRLDELKCDPIEGMAKLAQDKSNTPELRGRMYSELAQYVAPKRKAIELAAEVNNTVEYPHIATADELLAMMRKNGI